MRDTPVAVKAPPRNWWLISGATIVGFVLLLAFFGPSLAPKSPIEQNLVLEVNGKWVSAPYPPNTPGFPLGSDRWGHDVLSQLLWALRPTLILVLIVASLRLLFGTLIGLQAGWLDNSTGQAIDLIIRFLISVPVILVALAIVAAFQVAWGPTAFTLGLALTGWAETARIVRDQTRIIRQQLYIEAGRALGHSSLGLIWTHVLRQIFHLVWMLMAFEISNTLLIVAGLGFLGYYVGGEIWIWISDTAATRLSGMPELGQMLSGVSVDIFIGPWKIFAAGGLVFITMLGFNLLGEGLRKVTNASARPTRFSNWIRSLGWQIEERIGHPLQLHAKNRPFLFAVEILLILALFVGGGAAYSITNQPQSISLPIPGDHLWASQLHDPYGTLWTNAPTLDAPFIAWTYADGDGFAGGPAVASNGTLYLLSLNKVLFALDPDGVLVWKQQMQSNGVGSPALDADGNVYVNDSEGGLSSFTPQGELRWRFQPERNFTASSSPVIGANGLVHYVVIGDLIAVTTNGMLAWQAHVFDGSVSDVPIFSRDNTLIFLNNTILNAKDGEKVSFDSLPTSEQYTTGLDGQLYSRFERVVTGWDVINGQATLLNVRNLQFTSFFGFPGLEGVLQDGTIWQHFNSEYEDSALLWWNRKGDALASVHFPYRPSTLLGIDRNAIFYVCGSLARGNVECVAIESGKDNPEWKFVLPEGTLVSGGALVPGSLYVATEEGFLYALRAP